jgi:hypothetical protein
MKSYGLLFCLAASFCFAGDLQLTLPPVVYATPDVQMSIYHDNIVLTEKPRTIASSSSANSAPTKPAAGP